jgi:3-polyprenyl-4-hydroxybenzoate decarboxylase
MRLVLGITGASGAIYARRALALLAEHARDVRVDGRRLRHRPAGLAARARRADAHDSPRRESLGPHRLQRPLRQRLEPPDAVILLPCSMSALARVAHGGGDDLLARACEVALKERRRLILVVRETPLSLVHLRNMVAATEAGAIILPADPILLRIHHHPRAGRRHRRRPRPRPRRPRAPAPEALGRGPADPSRHTNTTRSRHDHAHRQPQQGHGAAMTLAATRIDLDLDADHAPQPPAIRGVPELLALFTDPADAGRRAIDERTQAFGRRISIRPAPPLPTTTTPPRALILRGTQTIDPAHPPGPDVPVPPDMPPGPGPDVPDDPTAPHPDAPAGPTRTPCPPAIACSSASTPPTSPPTAPG